MNGAAWLAIDQGDHSDAADRLNESVDLSRELNDRVGEGMAVLYLGRSKLTSLRVAEAAPYVEHAVALLTEARDPPGIALSLMYSGLVAQFTDQLEAACDLFARGVAMCRELGYRSLGARILQLLGIARLDLGELSAARTALEEALPVAIDIGDRWIIPVGLSVSPDSQPGPAGHGWLCDWPAPLRLTGKPTSSPRQSRSGRISTAG